MKQVTAKVIKIEQIFKGLNRRHARSIRGTWLVWLRCPEITREARPGQFVMVRCGEELVLPRPFSIHRVNDRGDIALFFAVWEDGRGTNWLSHCKAGDGVELFGPLGNGFSINPTAKNLLLVAGGIGIAPLYWLAQEASSRGCPVTLLLGAQTASQLYPDNLLPDGIELATATDDGSAGKMTLVTGLLPHYSGQADQIFACGPGAMYRDMARHYPQLKSKPVQISMEMRMGCGLGVCYGCTVKTKNGLKQVCRDGPVFNLADLLEEELSPI